MSLAKRVGYETLNEFKTEVAYQVRFEKTRTKHTKILFLTEGVLLRQMQTDSSLDQYDLIVVDEVHERHVFTDFLLGILKCLVRQRESLKIILMSATINIDLFSNYFNDCVIVKVSYFLKDFHMTALNFYPYCADRNFWSDDFGFIPFNTNLKLKRIIDKSLSFCLYVCV